MKKQGRILVVDDTESWREHLVEKLEQDGFHVEAVSSATEVRTRLEEALYHLVVLDICLDGTDESNTDGIGLLRELGTRGLSDAVKIIMLSGVGTKEQMRMAFKDYGVTDFMPKQEFSRQEFLQGVHKALSRINLALDIIWMQTKKSEQAVLSLEFDGARVERNTPLSKRMIAELEDLLCRLFCEAKGILVRPLTPTPSRSGAGVLWVQPFYAVGGGHAVAVKFGHFPKIETEARNFEEFVQPFIAGGHNTTIVKVDRTPHLGGIVYSLLGTTNDKWIDFGQFYHQSDAVQIKQALKRLFQDTCGAWYANLGQLYPRDLAVDYQDTLCCSLEEIEKTAFEQLASSVFVRNDRLFFDSLSERKDFTHPFRLIAGEAFIYPTYECITHGDLNQHNILVDSVGLMWLVDFECTRRSHILRDVATLDAVVRFPLLEEGEATLDERLAMEKVLCSIERFSQVEQLVGQFQTRNVALAKAYDTVVQLRLLACWMVDQNPSDDIGEYYVALLYNALNTLQFSSLSTRQHEHALLSASLLTDKLTIDR